MSFEPERRWRMQETLKALLVEFHEHETLRIPDLKAGLVEVAKDSSVNLPKDFDGKLDRPDVPPGLEPHVHKEIPGSRYPTWADS